MMRKLILTLLVLSPASSFAQSGLADEPLKPGVLRDRPVCPAVAPGVAPSADQRQRARDLVRQGQQAAVLGDSPAALRALRDAAALDPTDADLAYQLGRAYETAKDATNAVAEYCRFISLAPTSSDAGEAFEKVRTLTPARPEQVIDVPLVVFRSGVAAYQRGQFAAADSAFTRAIQGDSGWADAYYNRGRVHLARGERDAARADLARYLSLAPEATDRRQVAREVSDLGPETFSPVLAFAFGAVIPGGGEFYTHRPIRGAVTVVIVGVASAIAAQTQTVGRASTGVRTERPHLYAGIATAIGVGVLSAIDATWYAYSTQEAPVRLGLSIVPGANAVVARIAIPSHW
jgi:tetratricopeptide (TPR) repeat protein